MTSVSEAQPPSSNHFADMLPNWIFENSIFTWENLKEEKASLSPEELLMIEDERLGFMEAIEETPQLIARSLELMDIAIDLIDEKEPYETALFILPDHVQDTKFRLAFLRADRFVANAAARRMVDYWERKLELFGPDAAFKPYSTILDLPEEDIPTLVKGGFQILPNRDEFGRCLMLANNGSFGDSVESMVRYHWILLHMAIFDSIEGETTQKNGVVQLWSPSLPDHKRHPFNSVKDVERFVSSARKSGLILPVRFCAIHLMFKASRAWFNLRLLERLLAFMGNDIRLRLELYAEDHVDDNLKRLSNHGILVPDLPPVLGGCLEFDYCEWLYQQVLSLTTKENIENQQQLSQLPSIQTLFRLLLNEDKPTEEDVVSIAEC
eukprot:CAMPEP_0195287136 /NCGR_PEP_ID=MMETSP0707-20130614/4325_1 /TAXON_ID=33640 /ORGANISM="Asterionellopsis glacialis, Strain CCMP134" /LENGTH=379 /DNA_ID=CAMNT_0040346863 /DNA_START=13 /DNA_END=1152 /DNA_ORIENTATION=+